MNTALITLATMELPAPAEGAAVPDWIHLVPKGAFAARPEDGRGPWSYDDARAVIAESFARRHRIHIDENHSTDTAAKMGLSAPARGYITEMEERDTGIWGRVDWTESGRALLSDRSYWGISPVLSYDKLTGRVLAIARAALTNDPAVPDVLALNSTETPDMFLTKLAKMLGLPEDASEEGVLEALATRIAAPAPEQTETLSTIGRALGLEGEVSLTAVLAAARASTGQAEALATLQAEVTDLKAEGQRRAAEEYVDQAIRDRRSGLKASREEFVALHMETPARARAMIEKMPKLDPTNTTLVPPAPPEGQAVLSTEQMTVARMLGVDPEAMAKNLTQETR